MTRATRLASCLACAVLGAPALAQTGEYLVVAGDNGDLPGVGTPRFMVIQGGAIVRTWSPAAGTDQYQYPVAWDATVRTMGRDAGDDGAEYDGVGADLLARYTHPVGIAASCFDGTTDGTHTYTCDFDGQVWRLDADWANPVLLFSLPAADAASITYDRGADSLWIGRWSVPVVQEYAMDGTPLRTINTGHTKNAALALDHADGTLWLHDRNTQGTYEQWGRDGTFLQRIAVPGADDANALGAEFRFPQCLPDRNGDGQLNLDDVDSFVAAYLAGDIPGADLTGDDQINLDDLDAFIAAFLAGCP